MPDADYYIRQGDTGITIADVLKDATGAAVNIANATVSFLLMPIHGGAPLVSAAASNDQVGDGSDGTKGNVSYTWGTVATSVTGYFLGTWIVTYQSQAVQSFPNDGFILVFLSPDAPTAAGNNYVATQELKATLELSSAAFADMDIPNAIAAASRGIDEACNRWFYSAAADSDRYYTPLSADVVFIDDLYSLTSVATDQQGDGTFEQAWTVNTDFTMDPLNAAADGWPWTRIRRHPLVSLGFPSYYPRSVKVTGKFGWAAVPAPIVEATTILASKLLRRAREAPFGVVSIGIDIGATTRIAVTDPDVKFLIAPYMRERAA